MTQLRHKIGQMLVMGFSGCEIHEESPVVSWLNGDGLGGVLLFDYDYTLKAYGKNLKTTAQIIQLNQSLQRYAEHLKIPLFIAIDYEGGAVDRLKRVPGSPVTLTPCEQAQLSDAAFFQEASDMASTLRSLGFNLNFAPVVDLSLNQEEGIIGKLGRSFSSDPDVVIRSSEQFVRAFKKQGIACAYKHFPGHGSATGDTHEGFVDVTDGFKDQELSPYRALLQYNDLPAMVMTAHVINRTLDPSGLPATLSYPILTELLREKLGFNGVIISDDLQMHAISRHYELEDALRLTINAGADMMIFGNQLGYNSALEVVDRVERLVLRGDITQRRIDEAYERIIALKQASFSSTS